MYNIIFITNLPSFYKINLYNEISKQRKILVIFTHVKSDMRNEDFYEGKKEFDYYYLSNKTIINKTIFLFKILNKSNYKSLVIGGWDLFIYWVSIFLSPKYKNAVVIESSIFESQVSGLKGFVKKLFLSRISLAYVSGKSQIDLCNALKFKGKLIKTKGVGIFNFRPQEEFKSTNNVHNFLYVGRLASEKNLQHLVETFNRLPDLSLNIVGFGPLETFLKSIANENIIFHGAIPNADLYNLYLQNDVFILPSTSEPWGLVIEEALNCGLPVIVSNKVGCATEIVNSKNGIIFELENTKSLQHSILKMLDIEFYNSLRYNISKINFKSEIQKQINCFIQ